MDSVPYDGAVDDERLRYLLGLQTELPSLDYKQKYDRSTAGKSRFDFVKDCAAMLSRPQGGYLVVGVDDRGQPVASGLRAADFDSSRLCDMLAKHLGGSIDVRSAVHDVDNTPVALIYLARRAEGLFPIVKSDFTYTEPGGSQKTALRTGDVYVRDGTSTRRWRSADLPSLLIPYVEAARREERARVDDIVAAVRQQYRGLEAALGPATALAWQLGQEDFDTAITGPTARSPRSGRIRARLRRALRQSAPARHELPRPASANRAGLQSAGPRRPRGTHRRKLVAPHPLDHLDPPVTLIAPLKHSTPQRLRQRRRDTGSDDPNSTPIGSSAPAATKDGKATGSTRRQPSSSSGRKC